MELQRDKNMENQMKSLGPFEGAVSEGLKKWKIMEFPFNGGHGLRVCLRAISHV